jgi:hypothetical protein
MASAGGSSEGGAFEGGSSADASSVGASSEGISARSAVVSPSQATMPPKRSPHDHPLTGRRRFIRDLRLLEQNIAHENDTLRDARHRLAAKIGPFPKTNKVHLWNSSRSEHMPRAKFSPRLTVDG